MFPISLQCPHVIEVWMCFYNNIQQLTHFPHNDTTTTIITIIDHRYQSTFRFVETVILSVEQLPDVKSLLQTASMEPYTMGITECPIVVVGFMEPCL